MAAGIQAAIVTDKGDTALWPDEVVRNRDELAVAWTRGLGRDLRDLAPWRHANRTIDISGAPIAVIERLTDPVLIGPGTVLPKAAGANFDALSVLEGND